MQSNIKAYYNDRAAEYDKVYQNPPEQPDLMTANAIIQPLFSGKTVLEIACGTGYWTERIAATATSVHATDINQSMIDIALRRPLPGNVTFEAADLYNFTPSQQYDGIFGGFIWSHILLQDLDKLLHRMARWLNPGGIIVFIDSNYVPGTNHDPSRIAQKDEYGNTFQSRTLDSGARYLVLKNIPDQAFMEQQLSKVATDFNFINLTYYWIAYCRVSDRK